MLVIRALKNSQLTDGESHAIYGTGHKKKKPASVKTKAGFKLFWRNVRQRVRYLAFWRR
jgi:hypothetical protein